jgi:hypothetical protein
MVEHAEQFALLSLVVVIVALRTFVRVRNVGLRGLQLDDYLMPVAAVSQSTLTTTQRFGLD